MYKGEYPDASKSSLDIKNHAANILMLAKSIKLAF